MGDKAVLAYSGGLDTSVTIRWLAERGYEVHAVAVDVGQQEDFEGVIERGRRAGAASVRVIDAVERYAAEYLTKAIKANAMYEGKYPMVSGLARPCIAEEVIAVAREVGASTVAHGCTGKGNDQVRFEVSFSVLAPDLQCWRRSATTRSLARRRSAGRGVGDPRCTVAATYSIDENLWGRTAECGPLEDPWVAPPEDAFARTAAPAGRPGEPAEIVVTFDRGVPVALDGEAKTLPEVIRALDGFAGPTASAASTWSRTAGSVSRAGSSTKCRARCRSSPRTAHWRTSLSSEISRTTSQALRRAGPTWSMTDSGSRRCERRSTPTSSRRSRTSPATFGCATRRERARSWAAKRALAVRPLAGDLRVRRCVRPVGRSGLCHAVRAPAESVVGEAAAGNVSEDVRPAVGRPVLESTCAGGGGARALARGRRAAGVPGRASRHRARRRVARRRAGDRRGNGALDGRSVEVR